MYKMQKLNKCTSTQPLWTMLHPVTSSNLLWPSCWNMCSLSLIQPLHLPARTTTFSPGQSFSLSSLLSYIIHSFLKIAEITPILKEPGADPNNLNTVRPFYNSSPNFLRELLVIRGTLFSVCFLSASQHRDSWWRSPMICWWWRILDY